MRNSFSFGLAANKDLLTVRFVGTTRSGYGVDRSPAVWTLCVPPGQTALASHLSPMLQFIRYQFSF